MQGDALGLTRAAVIAAWPASRLPEALALVAACPDRGATLPASAQPGGCLGGELTACRRGKGAVPGQVCFTRCLACVTGSEEHAGLL